AERHRVAGGFGRSEQLLGIGALAVFEPRAEIVGAAETGLAFERALAALESSFPDCGCFASWHGGNLLLSACWFKSQCTSIIDIMPASACSRMWQCSIQSPASSGTSPTSMVSRA